MLSMVSVILGGRGGKGKVSFKINVIKKNYKNLNSIQD